MTTCGGEELSAEQSRSTAAQLLWDVADSADPHLDRPLTVVLTVASMPCVQARAVLSDVLSAFGWLAEDEPAVVMAFLGRLLNAVGPSEPS